ncbi:MAG TPA: DNA adenine methylase [Burkholderiales bacterium]|jgi:DNA adenine methylase|nr:DNA adenine methylase [Burkholderiales bacterium]
MTDPANRLVNFTPLRYPGGKGRLSDFVKSILRKNNLVDGEYCEPYAGGAAVALELLMHEYVTRIHINDISRPLYALWSSILNVPDEFSRKIRDATLSVRAWDRHKAIFRNADDHDDLDLGFATFYLNRTNRSGILRGGIIGGRAQTSLWGIDARYNAKDLAARVEAIASMRERIRVYNEDAADFLTNTVAHLPKRTLVYLDPPYFVKGKDLYIDHYDAKDHAAIACLVRRIRPQSWIVSYDDVPQIRALYSRYRGIRYELGYSARDAAKGVEVMYFSDNLDIPPAASQIAVLGKLRPRAPRPRTRATGRAPLPRGQRTKRRGGG